MLKDKVAVVTGASRGIGAGIAKALAAKDAMVIINYNGSEERAREVLEEIERNGGKGKLKRCNVADFGECELFIQEIIEEFGRLDILVNNAGITKDGLLLRMSEADFSEVIDVNLKGSFNCLRFASRQMIKQRSGSIINMSSVSGIMGNAGQVNYSASKAGIVGMTKSAAKELAGRGIRVNAVAPGFIDTEMTAALSDKSKEELMKQIPLGRTGKVEDIASAVVFLASEEASYITGQVLHVNGGMM